jgi:hypothetical protein
MLTPAELAAQLRISERQVQRLAAAGMPRVPVGARGVRYDLAACTEWLQKNMQCPSPQPRPAASKSLSASAVSAYIGDFRRAQLRVLPSKSKPN